MGSWLRAEGRTEVYELENEFKSEEEGHFRS